MKKLLAILLVVLTVVGIWVPAAAVGKNNESLYTPNKHILAEAYVLVSLDDSANTIITQKNADKKKYPASLTKIATAMVVLEHEKNLHKKVVVSKRAVQAIAGQGAQSASLRPGQRISIEQLLYLSLVYSACDACQVLAEATGGTVKHFTKMMNAWAKRVGCQRTHFVNPDGLHNKNHYSSAADIAKMAQAAVQNKRFFKIACTVQYRLGKTVFYHTNRMLHPSWKEEYYPYAKGIKTGYTKQAGRCLVTTAQKNGQSYLAVILNAPLIKTKQGLWSNGVFSDAKKLFNWAFASFQTYKVVNPAKVITSIPVSDSKKTARLALNAREELLLTMPKDGSWKDITLDKSQLPDHVNAPVKAGDTVCTVTVLYRGNAIGTVTLQAAQNVEFSQSAHLWRLARDWVLERILFRRY